jgi:hypothetical protein
MPAASTSTSRSKRKPRRSTGNLPWQPLRKFLEFEIESLTTTAGTEGNTCAFGSRPWVCEACTKSSTEELGNVSAGQLMAGQSTASKATQLHNNDVWRDWSKTRVPKVRKFQFAGATFTVDACHEPMVLMLRSAPFEE